MPVRQRVLIVAGLLAWAACASSDGGTQPAGTLAEGTWGGADAALIVADSVAHAHIGCTFGFFPAPVEVGDDARFSILGEYVLRAYPIQLGPSLPARFDGVLSGNRLTLTVVVNDTVEKKEVVKGPVTVYLGKNPELGPCPICQDPAASRRLMERMHD